MNQLRIVEILKDCLDDALIEALSEVILCEQPIYHAKSQYLEMHLQAKEMILAPDYERTLMQLRLALHTDIQLHLHYENIQLGLALLEPYLNRICMSQAALEAFKGLLPSFQEPNTLIYKTMRMDCLNQMQESVQILERQMTQCGFDVNIQCEYEDPGRIPEPVAVVKENPDIKRTARVNSFEHEKDSWSGYGGNKYEPIEIRLLQDGLQNVQIEGRIFALEIKELRNGRHLIGNLCVR